MNIHFIGIGGIGTSALAQYYFNKGDTVTGSDAVLNETVRFLKKKGVKVKIGKHKSSNVPNNTDLIVYSPAVKKDNPELKKNIKKLSYPEALAELTKSHYTVAISGTHGKSTTTAMISLIAIKAGLDPTVIVGTKLKEFKNTNFRAGKKIFRNGKPLLIIEADEHFASFLKYHPDIIGLTSIQEDHLDFYKNLNNILKTFKKYISPKDRIVIANRDSKNIRTIAKGDNVKWYSQKSREAKKIKKVLKIPGEHNVSNALLAFHIAKALGIKESKAIKALSLFNGTWRRFEIFKLKKHILVSDYGHHPTEIEVTIKAAREKWPKKKIWLVFQPHQYDRTKRLFNDFVKVLSAIEVEKLIIPDIYDVVGREEKRKVSSKELVLSIDKEYVEYIPSFSKIISMIKKDLKKEDVVIVMGAGDIYKKLTIKLTNSNR